MTIANKKKLMELEDRLRNAYLDCNYEHIFDFESFNEQIIFIWDYFKKDGICALNFTALVSQLFPKGIDEIELPLSVLKGDVA